MYVVASTERSSPHCRLNIDAYVLDVTHVYEMSKGLYNNGVMHADIVDELVGCASGPRALLASRVSYGLNGRCVHV